MSSHASPDPSKGPPPDNTFIESDEDVIGALAFSYYLLSSKDTELSRAVKQQLSQCTSHDAVVFRASADRQIGEYVKRQVETKIDKLRDQITQSTYNDIMRSNYDRLLGSQEQGLERILKSVDESASAWRQIIIAVIAAFAFGLIVSVSRLIDNPFGQVTTEAPKSANTGINGGSSAK